MNIETPQFETATSTRVVFGAGAVDQLATLVREYGGSHVMFVTDPGLVRAGHAARAVEVLQRAALDVTIFDAVRPNPTTLDVDACLAVARTAEVDFFLALGGGSSIDAAKGCNFLLTNGGAMIDYKGHGKVATPLLPLIAVPTTAGTGSEVQSFALIADEHTHMKMACGDASAAPRVAVLDPELAVTQPKAVIAASGMDAISHAVESMVARNATAESRRYAGNAFVRAAANFVRVLADPHDIPAQGEMLLAASLAGISIEKSMLGIAHSLANPLTAHFNAVHGQAVGVMLPHVVSFNAADPAAARLYAELARAARLASDAATDAQAAALLAAALTAWLRAGALPTRLADLGVQSDAIDQLAGEAANQWTARFNPREVTARELRSIYEQALE